MCSEGKGRAQGPTQAWVRVPVGGVERQAKTSKGDSLAPSTLGAAAPRDLPALGWSRGEGESTSGSTGPGNTESLPERGGLPLGTTGSPVCSQRHIGETCTWPTEKQGRNPEVLGVLGAWEGFWSQGGTTEAQPIIPQTREQGAGLNACVLGKWCLRRAIGPQEAGPTPTSTPCSSQILVLASSWQSAASHELKKIKRNKQTAPLLLLSIEVC